MGDKGNNLVIKSNELIESKYTLGLNEQKILLYAVSKIDKNSDTPNMVNFQIADYSETLGKSYVDYGEIKDAVNGLMDRRLEIVKDDGSFIKIQWVASAIYEAYSGDIQIEFSLKLMPYLLELKSRFTKYEFRNVVHMKSAYSIRLYELFKQQEFANYRNMSIEKLRSYLEIEDTYEQTSDLIKRVLTPAIEEINEQTDIEVSYERKFKGRTIIGFMFIIETKDKKVQFEDEYYNEVYDIPDLKTKMGVNEENFNSAQVASLYQAVISKSDGYDWSIYAKLNYKYVKDREKSNNIKNIYSYLLKAYEQDYAEAIKFIKVQEMLNEL